ncbi:MAG: DUF4421 family protein [Bacteroidota bacterium]
MKRVIILLSILCFHFQASSQVDSIARTVIDSIKSKLIIDEIPKKTFFDIMIYPQRWYVRKLLAKKPPAYDTTYIKNNKRRRITLTLPVSKKFYGFNISDHKKNRSLNFSPNTYYTIGIHLSNVIVSFGFSPGLKFGAKKDKGETKSKDFQLTVIGRKLVTDINYQRYRGFYIYNTGDFLNSAAGGDTTVIRPDINVTSFGINSNYIFNNKKYSLRGAFSFTDVQIKSAGSFMAGVYHNHVVFSANDSTFIRFPFINNFSPILSEINMISQLSAGVSIGYGYTFVYKRLIFSALLSVGVGAQKTYYRTMDGRNESFIPSLATSINAKNALRYDNQRFFIGILASYDNNFAINTKIFNNDKYIARVVAFTGYRFNIRKGERKILRALGLVDYNRKKRKK